MQQQEVTLQEISPLPGNTDSIPGNHKFVRLESPNSGEQRIYIASEDGLKRFDEDEAALPPAIDNLFRTPDYSEILKNDLFDSPFGHDDMEYTGVEGEPPTSPLHSDDQFYSPPSNIFSGPGSPLSSPASMSYSNVDEDDNAPARRTHYVNDTLQPDREGRYFELTKKIAENQQRERIAICPPDRYPVLSMRKASVEPCLVVADVVGWDGEEAKVIQSHTCLHTWTTGHNSMEVRPKTPQALSNNMDRQYNNTTGFFFHFKIFSVADDGMSYDLLDQLTTNVFRTVSHSKLCDSKRRKQPGKTKGRRTARKARYADDSSSSDFY